MPLYRVPLTTAANLSVDVEVPPGVTDPDTIAALAIEQAGDEHVELCIDCSGKSGLELGDTYRPVLIDGVAAITRL